VIMVAGQDAGQEVDVLRVDGGLASSAPFMQLQSDLAQVPVEVYPSPNATALGVAAAAHIGMQPSHAVGSIVGAWTPAARYEPRWSADRAAEYVERWRQAVATSVGAVGDAR
jgi:glycerol kinase